MKKICTLLLAVSLCAAVFVGYSTASGEQLETGPSAIADTTSQAAQDTDADSQTDVITLAAAAKPAASASNSEAISASYYAAQSSPVWEYFQNRSIEHRIAQWIEGETGIAKPEWNYDSFAQIRILNHDFESVSDDDLYYCTFSNGVDRYGYLIFRYVETGPAVQNLGVTETTPYLFDLEVNLDEIMEALSQTDIDLATATAERVSWLDVENNRSDQIILFTDAKGDRYVCYLGNASIVIEKK